MRTIFIPFLLLMSLAVATIAGELKLIPIIVDFKGVEVKGDTTYAYGNYGSLLQNCDGQKSWKQLRVFEKGNISGFINKNGRMVSFSNYGEMSVSDNNAISWTKINDLNDSVIAVIDASDRYFVRTKNKIFELNDSFEVEKECSYYTNIPSSTLNLSQSMVYMNGYLVVVVDSTSLVRFDESLKIIDTISINKYCPSQNDDGKFHICSDNNSIYFFVSSYLFRIRNFETIDTVYTFSRGDHYYYKTIDNVLYAIEKEEIINHAPFLNIYRYIEPDSVIALGSLDCAISDFDISDFTVSGDMITIVSKSKLIIQNRLTDKVVNRISDLSGISATSKILPEQINDSSYLFYMGSPFYRTDDSGVTFARTVGDSILSKKNFITTFVYKSNNDNKLYYGGYYLNYKSNALVLVTDDFGNSFDTLKMEDFTYNGSGIQISNIQKCGDYFHIALNAYGNKKYNWIYTYDKDFHYINKHRDSNYIINYINLKDTNNYTLLVLDSIWKIEYTTNSGIDWNVVKEYPNSVDTLWTDSVHYTLIHKSHLLNYKEVIYDNKTYLVIFSYNKTDSIYTIEALDIDNREMKQIYNAKTKEAISAAIDYDNDNVYLSLNDTLYVIDNIFERAKWYYYLLPYNGKINNYKLKKYNKRYFGYYSDDVHQKNLYWLVPSGELTSVEDCIVELEPYFYAYPPYPIPSGNSVRTLIYWESKYKLEETGFCIYDAEGVKVEGNQNIIFDKLSPYSGAIIWNCSQVSNGVYFIHIRHGNSSHFLKVMVFR